MNFDPAFVAKAKAYGAICHGLWGLRMAMVLGILGWLALSSRGQAWGSALETRLGGRSLAACALFALLLSLGLGLVTLPLATGQRGVDVIYGLAPGNWQASVNWLLFWATDRLMTALLWSAAALILVLAGRWLGHGWPWGAGLAALAGGTLIMSFWPSIAEPLLYKIEPIENGVLKEACEQMSRTSGLSPSGVYVRHASLLTNRQNAYVTGIGSNVRIVFDDTLLKNAPPDALIAVAAHEMGHRVHRHLEWGLALWACGACLLAHLVRHTATLLRRRGRPASPVPYRGADIPGLAFLIILGLMLGLPIENAVSRHMESQADESALNLSRDPASVESIERRLANASLTDPDPAPWVKVIFYTHPTPSERLDRARAWKDAGMGTP